MIIELGVKPENTDYINSKIRIANILSIFYAVLSIPFCIFSYILFPPLTYIPFLFFFLCLGLLWLNHIGLYQISRVVLSIGIVWVYIPYECFLQHDSENMYGSLISINILFLVIPWLLYDFREKYALSVFALIAMLSFLGVPVFNTWFSMDSLENTEMFKGGWLATLCYITSAFGTCGALAIMLFLNNKNELYLVKLIKEADESKKMMLENENQLNNYIAEVKTAQAEEQKRQWSTDGQAMLTEIIRKNDNLETAYDLLLSALVKYMGVNQGAIFILNTENDLETTETLILKACYAYNRKKYLNKTIAFGEGLVGQVVVEKETIFLTEIPQDYVSITSGLGDAKPSCVIVCPLKLNEKVMGVIELASFRILEKHEIAFLEKVGEILASTIYNLQNTERTKRLLDELQIQTEQMRAQEEEMRQNMEEMQATQEEMQRLLSENTVQKQKTNQQPTKVYGKEMLLDENVNLFMQ